MDTARLFQSGRSQAVRLPKEFRFVGTEVAVRHFGNGVLLLPLDDPWQTLEEGLAAFEPGFTLQREQPALQGRPDIAAAPSLAAGPAQRPASSPARKPAKPGTAAKATKATKARRP